jgi:hypothetical protein
VFVTLFYLVRPVRLHASQLSKQIESDLDALTLSAYDPIYEGRNAKIMVKGLGRSEKWKKLGLNDDFDWYL